MISADEADEAGHDLTIDGCVGISKSPGKTSAVELYASKGGIFIRVVCHRRRMVSVEGRRAFRDVT